MEPKKIKKLHLKKETISQLEQQQLKAGCGCTNSTTCGNSNTETMTPCITKGDCDINTISDPGCAWQTYAWYCIIGCV